MRTETLEQENKRLRANVAELRRRVKSAERKASRAKASVSTLRDEKKRLKAEMRKMICSDEALDSILANICAAIDDLDKKSEAMAHVSGEKVIKYVRSKLIDRLMLSGASVIKNEHSFDFLRHNPIDITEQTVEGCNIETTVKPGVEFGGKVYLRAIVKLKD